MEPSNITNEIFTKIFELGRKSAGPQIAPGSNIPYVIDASGNPKSMPELIYNDYERKLVRIAQTVTVNDAPSFVEYFKLFADADSRIFADSTQQSLISILDYHQVDAGNQGVPRHGTHKLALTLLTSPAWKTWTDSNNDKFDQQEFAEFLEQNAVDITNPSPAAIREVGNDLQMTTEVEFGSAKRQSDGQTVLRYSEVNKATVGGSQISIPDGFKISIPVFVGGGEVDVDALMRVRANSGHLQIWYTLVRPEEAIRKAFSDIVETISADLSKTIIRGSVR